MNVIRRPEDAVVAAISRLKLQSPHEDGRDLLAGFTGEDSAPDITDEISAAIAYDWRMEE